MVPGQVHYSSACQCVDDDTAMIEVRPDTRKAGHAFWSPRTATLATVGSTGDTSNSRQATRKKRPNKKLNRTQRIYTHKEATRRKERRQGQQPQYKTGRAAPR